MPDRGPAIMGKRDELRGLKENVIVGRLILARAPAAPFHETAVRSRRLILEDAERAIADAGGRNWPPSQMAQVDADRAVRQSDRVIGRRPLTWSRWRAHRAFRLLPSRASARRADLRRRDR